MELLIMVAHNVWVVFFLPNTAMNDDGIAYMNFPIADHES